MQKSGKLVQHDYKHELHNQWKSGKLQKNCLLAKLKVAQMEHTVILSQDTV